MFLREYVDPVFTIELERTKQLTLENIILQFHSSNLKRIYIINENKPIFVITSKEIIDFFINNTVKQNAYDFLKDKNFIECFKGNKNIIDTYYDMRKANLDFMPVCEEGRLIGEVDFSVLSLKISYIVIKDELTGVYNKKYFDVIINEYMDFDKPMGIIFIELKDLAIYEGLYGVDFARRIIKKIAREIQKNVRKIDFIFRWDNQFRIIIFNNMEISAKVFSRIKAKLRDLKVDGIHVPYKMAFSHIPELEDDIILALQSCEEELIKRN